MLDLMDLGRRVRSVVENGPYPTATHVTPKGRRRVGIVQTPDATVAVVRIKVDVGQEIAVMGLQTRRQRIRPSSKIRDTVFFCWNAPLSVVIRRASKSRHDSLLWLPTSLRVMAI